MKKKNILFIILIALAAFSISGVGAWFSVYGLTKVFAAGWLTYLLFGALEFAKLVVVSYVYRFWIITTFFQRFYLIPAIIILMGITSIGIYGFLTNSYQKTASLDKIQNSEVTVYEMKKSRFDENRTYYIGEKEVLDNSISELRKGLSNNVIQYTDTTGRLITTTSSSTRKALQEQLNDAMERRDKISIKLEAVTDSLSFYDRKIYELESTNQLANELGPLKYLATITVQPMDKVVNWLALLIVFVFDPLAIVLIISLNQLMLHSGFDPFDGTKSKKKIDDLEKETKPEVRVVEVIKEVPVEVIKEVPVEVIKEVPVEPTVEPTVEPKVEPKVETKLMPPTPKKSNFNTDDITQVTSHINKAQFTPKDK